jgi:methyltransferase (TIGR00027 family)
MRALHRIVDREPWVLDDPVSLALFGDLVRARLEAQPDWLQDARSTALRGHVLLRSAFAESRMRDAVERGVRQCVALGAGFDTFAYRQPAWMRGAKFFEVDAPVTQAEKRRRFARAGLTEAPNVVFVPIDFETTTLAEGLAAAGFDASAPAFFSVLGVLVYLSEEAVDSIFHFVGSLPAGSEIAFTFTQPGGDVRLALSVAAIGEPMRSHFEPEDVEAKLRVAGFSEVSLLSVDEIRALLGPRSDALSAPRRMSLGAAIV